MDTVWHEIAFGLENLGMPYEQMKRTVAEIVNYFDLQKIYHEDTDKLSGGQKQLVNLAAVMAMHPKVLILDEPTAQLDPAARKDFLVMLQKLHKEFGLTIILTSHNLEDVMKMSDECVILDDGKVIEQGNPKEVARHLQKIHHPLEQSLPQILRLEEKFQIELTFSMEEGEYTAVMGESGSGKTTLLNLLASFDRPTSGDIILNGLPFRKIQDKDLAVYRRKNLGFVFQDFNLLDTLSVRDNIFLPLVLAGEKTEEMKKRLSPLVKVLRISDLLDKFPYEISGGQKQRTAIARALITEPKLILADEPTGALDSRASHELLHMFEQINQAGQTILMVTHSTTAASHAKRVLFIKDGTVYHQIYRGDKSRDEMFRKISETLTVMASGGKEYA